MGVAKRQACIVEKLVEPTNSDALRIVSATFSNWSLNRKNANDEHLVTFRSDAGGVKVFKYVSNGKNSLARDRYLGIWSFVAARIAALQEFISLKPIKHALIVAVADDTQVWTK